MEQPFLILTKDTTREMITNEEIVYVTLSAKSPNYIVLKLLDSRTLSVKTSLRQFEKKLPPHLFLRIHKSYIVCIRHVKSIDRIVTMKNKDELPLSREYKEDFLSHFCVF